MKANLITIFGCPVCGEAHTFEEDALECCQAPPPEIDRYECGECYSLYEEISDAEDCCTPEDENLLIPDYLRRIPRLQLEAYGQQRLL